MNPSNIPMGAEYDSRAPWNQIDNDYIDRDCNVIETLSKRVTLSTTDYIPEEDWNDEFGKCISEDTSETDWKEEYITQEYTILGLISKLKEYVIKDLGSNVHKDSEIRKLNHLLSCCEDWEQVELEVEEE